MFLPHRGMREFGGRKMARTISHSVYCWGEAYEAGNKIVGGKGWNLGRLNRNGFRIPSGIVLATHAYQTFIRQNQLQDFIQNISVKIDASNIGERNSENGLAEVRQKIVDGLFPVHFAEALFESLENLGILNKSLAVRSSASAEDSLVASFAGIHSSYLNVNGKESIVEAVKNCYASLWTPAAVAYRRKMNINDNDVLQAVVIMEMVKAEAAGVAFTCDPLTGRTDTMVINANYGLGEAVVGGLVEPDEYKLTFETFLPKVVGKKIGLKRGQSVLDSNQGVKFIPLTEDFKSSQVLNNENIFKLALLVQRVYEALGEGERHQDIEWVFNGQEFMIVQARPVTLLTRYTYPELKDQPDIWSNANIKDALPMVLSTLSQRTIRVTTTAILTSAFKASGYPILPGLKLVRFYRGRGYFNLSLIQREYFDAWGLTPSEVNKSLGGYQPEIDLGSRNRRYTPKKILYLIRGVLAVRKSVSKADKTFQEVRSITQAWLKNDLKAFSNEQIISLFEEMGQYSYNYYLTDGLLNFSAGSSFSMLCGTLNKHFPGKGMALANALMLGQGKITSAEQGYRLMQLADSAKKDPVTYGYFREKPFDPLAWESKLQENSAFKKSFREFLDEFGHRAVYEGDIRNPHWKEDPSYLLKIIADLMDSPEYQEIRDKQKERNKQAWREINQTLSFVNRKVVKWMVDQAVKGSEKREMGKSELVRLRSPYRSVLLELGQRLVDARILNEQTDVFQCTFTELISILREDWEGKELRTIVEDRIEQQKLWAAMEAPDIIIDDAPQVSPSQVSISLDGNLVGVGIGAAAGKASGIARLIKHPSEGQRLKVGDVLVAPTTDPGWTPLFIKASAIIVESGGYLSHGAIVAREYGIPAVINVPNAMSKLKDGMLVLVDGDEGKILVL